MGVDYNSGVILGVTLSDLGFKIEQSKEKFEVHDKKGNPTGKFDFETKFKLSFEGKEKIFDGLYFEYIEELVDLKGKGSKLEIFNIDCEDIDTDKIIVGIKVARRGYNDWNLVKEIPQDQYSTVEGDLRFNLNSQIKPKFYFYFYSS